ncbi:hypothetical protein BE221DRAFT_74402 [Ostreococcus tauri]|uniref:Alpha/Beta hydrolase protein n=1 Tax=Ostreococcus tauri TaxID=70448 RepID=A0A1Y5IAP4_OSTTA|nr:hypothetical protein BE221DRAFT_74402 [Ostreococcus tauri]
MLRAASLRAIVGVRATASSARRARDDKPPRRTLRAASSTSASVSSTTIAPFCELLSRDESSSNATRPLAVVIGWFGCELRHVKKYAMMYVDAEWDAVAVAPPSVSTLVPSVADTYGDYVLRALSKRQAMERRGPIVVHVASNGGFIFAGNLMLKARNGDARARALFDRTKGFVFDCAPGNLRPDIIARAAAAVIGGASATTEPAPIFEAFAKALMMRPSIDARLRSIDEVWGKAPASSVEDASWTPPHCPAMFAYSEADVLISPREIEAFARLREEKTGARSDLHKYHDAAHCEIGREASRFDDYRKKVHTFLSEIRGATVQ